MNIASSPRDTHMLHNNQTDQQDTEDDRHEINHTPPNAEPGHVNQQGGTTRHHQYCCVDGSRFITMHPEGQRALCEIRRGDQIMAHNGSAAT
eukprot:6179415-Heterocapsa_arctica.AAC.1